MSIIYLIDWTDGGSWYGKRIDRENLQILQCQQEEINFHMVIKADREARARNKGRINGGLNLRRMEEFNSTLLLAS